MYNRRMPKGVPDPSNIDKWIITNAVKESYIFYSRKEKIATCSRCGKTFSDSMVLGRHGEETTCPECESITTLKSSGRGRENLTDYFRTVTFRRRGRTVYGYLTTVDAVYEKAGPPTLYKYVSDVYVFNSDRQEHWKRTYNNQDMKWKWRKCNSVYLPQAPSANAYTMARYWFTFTYNANLKDIFENSDLKYLSDICKTDNPYHLIQLMYLGLKYPAIEMMYKAGFRRIVYDRLEGSTTKELNWRGKNLQKILKLPRWQVRFLQAIDPDISDLIKYKLLTMEERDKLTIEEYELLPTLGETKRLLKGAREYVDVNKFLKYMLTQRQNWRINDWLDYIENAKKLGMDIKRKSVLFPKDFIAAHDELIEAVKVEKRAANDRAMRAHAFNFGIESEDLLTIEAICQDQLSYESLQLGHCVRTYGDRVAAGRSHIFLIRRKEEPEKPFYTLETNAEGGIVQCRGNKNINMTEEVSLFVEEFKEELSRHLRQQKRIGA